MSTVNEIIREYPALGDIGDGMLSKAVADRDLSGDASYVSTLKQKTELVAADLMMHVATSPEFKEGDLSIKHKPAELKAFAKLIYDEYDDPKADTVFAQPTVKNASSQW